MLAKGMDVRLGALIYVSNQFSVGPRPMMRSAVASFAQKADTAPRFPLNPKVSRSASVYAVYSIE